MKKIPTNRIFVQLRERDRDQIFYSKLNISKKKVQKIMTSMPAAHFSEKSFEQSLTFGKVTAVCDDEKAIAVGDYILLDYTADKNEKLIAFSDSDSKTLCVIAHDTYHKDDLIIPITQNGRSDTYVYREGDRDEVSPILAVIRRGKITPHDALIMCDHHDDDKDIKKVPGLIYDYKKATVVARVIAHSRPEYGVKRGDHILAEAKMIFPFVFGDFKYDFLYYDDILLKVDGVKYFTK